MLWAGATPEEISDLQFEESDKASLTQLRELTKMQVGRVNNDHFAPKRRPTLAGIDIDCDFLFL